MAVVGTFLNSPSMDMFVSGPECLGLIKQELRHGQGFGRLRNIKIINTRAFRLPAACGILLESLLRKGAGVDKLICFFFLYIASNLNPKTHWLSYHRQTQKLGWHGIKMFSAVLTCSFGLSVVFLNQSILHASSAHCLSPS